MEAGSEHNQGVVVGKRYVVFRSFLTTVDGSADDSSIGIALQRRLVREVLYCHARNKSSSCSSETIKLADRNGDNEDDDDAAHDITLSTVKASIAENVESSLTSIKLELGIACGGDLSGVLPLATSVARRAYQQAADLASKHMTLSATESNQVDSDTPTPVDATFALPQSSIDTLRRIAKGPLSGLSLLYGTSAFMRPHYDSPTQPNQRDEWLVMITLGNTVDFRCNNDVIPLYSGDVIVMDSMAVLHGVERIHRVVDDDGNSPTKGPICTQLQMPWDQVRLGILFWQGSNNSAADAHSANALSSATATRQDAVVDGVANLFGEESD